MQPRHCPAPAAHSLQPLVKVLKPLATLMETVLPLQVAHVDGYV